MPPVSVSRRGLLGTSAALAAAGGLAALDLANATPAAADVKTACSAQIVNSTATPALPANKLAWSTYGDWSEQRLEPRGGYLMGRFDSFHARVAPTAALPGGASNLNPAGVYPAGSFELWQRFDRAEADQLRNMATKYGYAQPTPEMIADNCWKGAAWSSDYVAPAQGTWEIDVTMPSAVGMGYALMLWPKDDSLWPYGEIDILEGTTGVLTTSNNLHWKGADGSDQFDQKKFDFNTAGKHRYKIDIQPGSLSYYIDGTLIRTIKNSQVPYGLPSHLVMQFGADRATMGPNGTQKINYNAGSTYYFEQCMVVTPITMP